MGTDVRRFFWFLCPIWCCACPLRPSYWLEIVWTFDWKMNLFIWRKTANCRTLSEAKSEITRNKNVSILSIFCTIFSFSVRPVERWMNVSFNSHNILHVVSAFEYRKNNIVVNAFIVPSSSIVSNYDRVIWLFYGWQQFNPFFFSSPPPLLFRTISHDNVSNRFERFTREQSCTMGYIVFALLLSAPTMTQCHITNSSET